MVWSVLVLVFDLKTESEWGEPGPPTADQDHKDQLGPCMCTPRRHRCKFFRDDPILRTSDTCFSLTEIRPVPWRYPRSLAGPQKTETRAGHSNVNGNLKALGFTGSAASPAAISLPVESCAGEIHCRALSLVKAPAAGTVGNDRIRHCPSNTSNCPSILASRYDYQCIYGTGK